MRSITKCRTTVLAVLAALPAPAVAAPAVVPQARSTTDVRAWVVGETGFESTRFVKALRIDGLDAATIAERLAAIPSGRRVAYSESLLAGLVGDSGDRIVVSGRITDHPSPWIDTASLRTRLEVEQVAKELAARGLSIDAVLLGGTNPLYAEKIDTPDDLIWMAIRNDLRFESIPSSELTLAGAMSPSNPQWRAWNEFADVTIAKAIAESVASPLRELGAPVDVAAPISDGIARRELDAMPMAIRMHGVFGDAGAGGATTAFEVLSNELELAVKASSAGRTLQPWIRPYTHAGTRDARSALAGTLLWDELVRHAMLLGSGRVVYMEDRALELAAADAARFDSVIDGVAEQFVELPMNASSEASFRRGEGWVAVGIPSVSGGTLWRISFSPGIGGVDVEIDGGGLRVERRRGESGAWLRTEADSRIEFFDRAFARSDVNTGGGLLAEPISKQPSRIDPLLSGGASGDAFGGSGLGDLNGDGVVDGADLAIQLSGGADSPWGGMADLNGDGVVDGADMSIALSGGPDSPWSGSGWNDLNGDGLVDGADLALKLGGAPPDANWNGAGWNDLDGNGVNDGADLAIELAGRIKVRGADVAGRPRLIEGGVSVAEDSADDGAGSGGSNDGTSQTGGTPPTVDPTTPVTPPAPGGGEGQPGESRPNLPIPVLLSDSLLETTGTSLYVAPGITEEILASGGMPVRVVYQMVDPTASQGLASAEHVAAWVESEWGSNPTGWFVLDYEVPHMTNLAKGLQNPQDPAYLQTRDSLVAAIRELKVRFPNARWSYYGMPSLPSWFAVNGANHTHVSIPISALEPILEQRRNNYQAVIDECDFVCPTIYDRHDERNSPTPAAAAQSVNNTRLRNERLIALSKSLVANSDRPDRPVLPFVNLWYAPGGIGEDYRMIPRDQVRSKQIEPAVAAGAESIVVWTAAGFYARLATLPDQPSNQEQQQVRAAFASDLLDGAPSSWQDMAVRQEIVNDFANEIRALLETIVEVRAAASPE